LSVAFYFKATDTSNKFYDNTYKFTKEISEILGRIEAGFGERLRHLDEGYSGLVDKFDGNSVQDKTDDIEAAKLELEEEKKKIEKEVEEKDQILETLLKKAKVNDTEKAKILSELKEKEQEISSLSNEMRYLKRNISRAERSLGNDLIHSIPPSLREMITDYLKSNTIDINMLLDAPLGYLKRRMKFEKEKFPLSFYERFLKYDIIENDDRFTERGLEIMKYLANRI
jgi:predicted RNase H-like nuclease (RuvC/YqgF family)